MVSLEARQLSLSFDGQALVVADLDLKVEAGQLTALVGPNGAGKSTLLRACAGLMAPESGAVFLQGRNLKDFSAPERARQIALVPQDGRALVGTSVYDFVLGGRYAWRKPWSPVGAEDVEKVQAALVAAELEDRREMAMDTLSGGERQRAFFARALAQDAEILLVDEPTASLDPRHQVWVFDRLAEQADRGRSVLVVTHDLNLASQYADRLHLLVAGQLRASGAADEVLDPALLKELYGSDFLTGLGQSARFQAPRPFILAWRQGAGPEPEVRHPEGPGAGAGSLE